MNRFLVSRLLQDETLSLKDSLKLRDEEVYKVKGDQEVCVDSVLMVTSGWTKGNQLIENS